jgi:hypothetical protein
LPQFAPPLAEALVKVALALASRPGSRIAAKLAMPCCRDVLIRLIRAQPVPGAGRIEVLGVDLRGPPRRTAKSSTPVTAGAAVSGGSGSAMTSMLADSGWQVAPGTLLRGRQEATLGARRAGVNAARQDWPRAVDDHAAIRARFPGLLEAAVWRRVPPDRFIYALVPGGGKATVVFLPIEHNRVLTIDYRFIWPSAG